MALAGVGSPGEGLSKIQDLLGPDDLLTLSQQLAEDGLSYLSLQQVGPDR